MNIALKLWRRNFIYRNSLHIFVSQNVPNYYTLNILKLYNKNEVNARKYVSKYKFILAGSFLTWLGLVENDEEKESELIMTIKRAVLLTQRGEYPKAEQMLHLALRLSQEQQNKEGVLYIYDLMANLALERGELDKAEKLFVNVLQRLLSEGTKEDDLKVIHISLKMARICHMKGEKEKAEIGFKWCLDSMKKKQEEYNDIDTKTLHGIVQDWYAQYLLEKNNINESLNHLKEAHKICCDLEGETSEKCVLLLNDIGTANWRLGRLKEAEEYLSKAVNLGKNIKDFDYLSVIYSNLGLVTLQNGFLKEAMKYCKEGWRLGNKFKNNEALEQANYCFEEIRSQEK